MATCRHIVLSSLVFTSRVKRSNAAATNNGTTCNRSSSLIKAKRVHYRGYIKNRISGMNVYCRCFSSSHQPEVYICFSHTDLVNATTFALQNDHLQELGCMAFWVLAWITCQDLREVRQSGKPQITTNVTLLLHHTYATALSYLLAHAIDDLQVFGVR